jgi:hypothetical protein
MVFSAFCFPAKAGIHLLPVPLAAMVLDGPQSESRASLCPTQGHVHSEGDKRV